MALPHSRLGLVLNAQRRFARQLMTRLNQCLDDCGVPCVQKRVWGRMGRMQQ
jgi:hypothetical protein